MAGRTPGHDRRAPAAHRVAAGGAPEAPDSPARPVKRAGFAQKRCLARQLYLLVPAKVSNASWMACQFSAGMPTLEYSSR